MTKKVLITGSCGFVMSNFIRKSLHNKLDYVFVSLDKVKKHFGLHNVYANKGHTFYIGNILDNHFLDVVFSLEKPDYVIHAAEERPAYGKNCQFNSFQDTNIIGTSNVINARVKAEVKRIFYLSNYEVYGNKCRESHDEASELSPINSFAASKVAAEVLIRAACSEFGLNYNILRSCDLFGPRQFPDSFIPGVLKNILEKKKTKIYDNGLTQREWLYVGDLCNALTQIMMNANQNETFNVSAGYEFSDIEMFHEICTCVDQGYDLVEIIGDNNLASRYAINSDKLKSIGWKPSAKYKETIAFSINWYLKNKWYIRGNE